MRGISTRGAALVAMSVAVAACGAAATSNPPPGAVIATKAPSPALAAPLPLDTPAPVVSDPVEFVAADDIPVMYGVPESTSVGLLPVLEQPSGWVPEPPPEEGDVFGRIVLPQIDIEWDIIQGVSVPDLRVGPGHMPKTAMPGQIGNAVLSGHRTTYGAPFNRLDLMNPGDRFFVETAIGTHTYEVVSLRIVHPREMWVTTQWEGAWLTLTTCHPKGSSAQRLILFAKLVDGPNAEAAAAASRAIYSPPEPPDA